MAGKNKYATVLAKGTPVLYANIDKPNEYEGKKTYDVTIAFEKGDKTDVAIKKALKSVCPDDARAIKVYKARVKTIGKDNPKALEYNSDLHGDMKYTVVKRSFDKGKPQLFDLSKSSSNVPDLQIRGGDIISLEFVFGWYEKFSVCGTILESVALVEEGKGSRYTPSDDFFDSAQSSVVDDEKEDAPSLSNKEDVTEEEDIDLDNL